MARLRRVLALMVLLTVGCGGTLAVAGYFLFTRPHGDKLTKADAIIVLGGDNDGRLEYGLSLAEHGYADTLVLSNSYSDYEPDYANYRRACASGSATLTVVCFLPTPYTTRGEAMFLARLAKRHNWTHVIVVSWNYHMVRARYIFHQCFDGTVTMRPVPRSYDYSLWRWTVEYAHQYGGLAKAFVLGCDADR